MTANHNCDTNVLKNKRVIKKLMIEAAIKSNASVVTSCFHKFNPWGISGAVIVKESHLTIYIWTEYGYASVDLFTCGDNLNPWVGFLNT